jgi:hypothetical protein
MEQMIQVLDTAWRVLLAGAVALTPGALVWLVVLGAFLLARQVVRSDSATRLRNGGQPS